MKVDQKYVIAYWLLIGTIFMDFVKYIYKHSITESGYFIFILCLLSGIYALARVTRKGKKWPAIIFIFLILIEIVDTINKTDFFNKESISLAWSFVLIFIESLVVFLILTAPKQIKEKVEDATVLDYNID